MLDGLLIGGHSTVETLVVAYAQRIFRGRYKGALA